MADLGLAQEQTGVKRRRPRKESLVLDQQTVVDRVLKFYRQDLSDRTGALDAQLQRYAKLRMWTEGKDYPWEDATDAAIPDVMSHSLKMQDTLVNAVLTMRPAISSNALSGKEDQEKQDKIDRLIDFQVFVENQGEKLIGDGADAFVNDPCLIIYTPWVREEREVCEIRLFPAIPDQDVPVAYFKDLLTTEFRDPEYLMYKRGDGWDWELTKQKEKIKANFYTRDNDEVELVLIQQKSVFDGPRPTVLEWQDVLYPVRAANLQPPGPANPRGASHVILRSYPHLDEIKRLVDSGFYDLVSDEDMAKLFGTDATPADQEQEDQKDKVQGVVDTTPAVESHRPLTRLMCFDRFDIDGDGLDEDVIFWVIEETGTLLRAKYLTEMFPTDPPRRPLAHSSFIGVRDRVDGISLPELLEGTHDLLKQFTDQVGDSGTIANSPFGFYDPNSSMKPEVIRMSPGDLYPVANPAQSVHFPQMQSQSQAFGINMITMFGAQQDRLAVQGDLQFGRVPPGQSSALRTAGGQQSLLMQGEARPERILRRFFNVWVEVWTQIHQLNQRFLPVDKKYKVIGFAEDNRDPYAEIKHPRELSGRFQFEFKANVLNSSKQALQGSLMQLLPIYLNPIPFQLGLLTPEKIYGFYADLWRAFGQDPRSHLQSPTPEADLPQLMAEEVISMLLHGVAPYGRPAEPTEEHLQKLIAFMQSDDFGYLESTGVQLFQQYVEKTKQRFQQEQQLQLLAQSAQQFAGQQGVNGQGAAPASLGTPKVQENELIDETLPSAGGGKA